MYLLTKSLDFSLQFKFFIYTFFAYRGFVCLFRPLISTKKFGGFTCILFSIALVSVIGNPILYHEAGPLTFWYLLLTPYWIHLLIELNKNSYEHIFKSYDLYLLIFLTIGASDLFIYFYFASFLFLPIILKKRSLKRTFFFVIIIELVLMLAELPYIFFSLSENYETYSGTWNSYQYLNLFIKPLLLHSLVVPNFTGPVIIFINFIQFGLIFYIIIKWWKYAKKVLLFILFMLIFLLLLGILLHSLPVTRENLPSAFRYHVAAWPILVSCLLPILFYEIYANDKINSRLLANKFVGIVLSFFITLTLANIDKVYSQVLPNSAKMLVNKQLRVYSIETLPNCVNDVIQKNGRQRSFLFSSGDGANLSASLNILIDNPSALNGRTFNRWSYSLPSATVNLNQKFGLEKFFTRPFNVNDTEDILDYARSTGSYYLLSNNRIDKFKLLTICKPPLYIKSKYLPFSSPTLIDKFFGIKQKTGESSYNLPIYVYDLYYKMRDKLPINLQFSSSHINAKIACSESSEITLPINYDDSIRINNLKPASILKNPQNNFIAFDLKNIGCKPGKTVEVKIFSTSKAPLSDLIIFLTLFILILNYSVPKSRKRE